MKSHTRVTRGAKMLLNVLVTTMLMLSALAPAAKAGSPEIQTVVISLGNSAPVAENIDIRTYRGIAVNGQLTALDPEGEQITFQVDTQPRRGTVQMGAAGDFIYTPGDTKKATDTFTYTATDESGNVSVPSLVTIHILKQMTEVTYSDMIGNSAHYDALALAEAGVYQGEKLGAEYFFNPDESVSAGEFLAMCLDSAGTEILTGVVRTGLKNDTEIPVWTKQYVSTAILSGSYTGGTEFDPDATVTFEGAAIILDGIYGITDVISASTITPYLRVDSYQAVINLYECGITDETIVSKFDETLTRADAASMLCRAMEMAESRK